MNALVENLPDWLSAPTFLKWSEALPGIELILLIFGMLRMDARKLNVHLHGHEETRLAK
jgi:hypothetical protein